MTDTADAQNPLAGVLSADQVDALVNAAEDLGEGRHGVEELLSRMTQAVLERALETEMSDHLGYEAGDPAGAGTGNSRNGKTTKSVQTLQGPVQITVPRDRNGSFEPVIVPKRSRRLGRVEDMILSLYARGMTTRDIGSHLEEIYGSKVSAATISRVTDVVADEVRDELVAAHADRAVHAPQRRIQVEARERARPRDGMVVRRVDEGAVDVEQDR